MVIRGRADIRDAYRDETVAADYIGERFTHPLGALLHSRQLRSVQRLINRQRPARVLELAPGPARVTAGVSLVGGRGVMVDASAQMLEQARKRLRQFQNGSWRLVQADGFHLPFGRSFDLVYTFRFLRHFDEPDRQRLYRGIANVLRPGGLLVFDAVNERVSAPLRAATPGGYRHYDALLRPELIRNELSEAGFELVELCGVQHRYSLLYTLDRVLAPRSRTLARLSLEIVDRTGGEPLEWVVTCRRR